MGGPVVTLVGVVAVGRATVAVLAGVVGLFIGSFLNVVVYRVPRRISVVEPRSFCPHCHTPVRSVDNVPLLSWVVLRGRCRHCREPISVRYPSVELAGGVVFAAVGWTFGPHPTVVGFCVLAATVLALTVIALDRDSAPSVAVIGTAIGVPLLVVAGVVGHHWASVAGLSVAVGVAALVVAGLRRVGAPGWATAAPPLLPVGAALGWLGAPYAGEGLAAAAVVTLALVATRRLAAGTRNVPVGVLVTLALALGAVAAAATAVALGAAGGT